MSDVVAIQGAGEGMVCTVPLFSIKVGARHCKECGISCYGKEAVKREICGDCS